MATLPRRNRHGRRVAVLAGVLGTLLIVTAAPVSANPPEGKLGAGTSDAAILALITDDDVFSIADLTLALPLSSTGTPPQKYGPFHSFSPDSGTCGNDWAVDEIDRYYTVRQTGPTSYTVVEQFKNGTFVTDGPTREPSPGACEDDPGNPPGDGNVIDPGIEGTMHGYFIIQVTNAVTFNPSPTCPGDPTSAFLACHFPGATSDIPTFFFHFAGYDGFNKSLIEHEWKNASADRGGNHGDIATDNVP